MCISKQTCGFFLTFFSSSELLGTDDSDAPAFDGEIWWKYPNPRFTDLIVNLH
ncbi:MAG: hypothetical protein HXX08_21815 [Chloroflexi bacterium]|uniref:Uncharacterized protein n=1 Tax=Candidatus Chlorohelix allophototropha TaxID=3003348 RepID=A0A8T7M923_9CHLR|nr:hypothetical protein [Chloroflexota bacterium]WJW68436.1 hypothetical protein OZ401_004047 [Chloroflexota bacterium L227-S17]